MHSRFAGYAAPAYLALCLLLGGASAAGAGANAALQVLGLALIVAALWNLRESKLGPQVSQLLWLAGLFVLLVTLYLVPLPPQWWSSVPGRESIERGFALLGMPPTALPVSLSRDGTIASALSLIPPTAMFLLVVQMRDRQRRTLAWLVLSVAAFSILLGAFQLVGGPDSSLRFYEITNRTVPVGFFSNANHLATLVLCALPFVGFLAARAVSGGGEAAKRKAGLVLSGSIGLFLAVGLGSIGSLAGYSLFLPVATATVLIYKRATGLLNRKWLTAAGGLFLVFLAFALTGPINQEALSAQSGSASSRQVIAARTLNAVGDFMPAGSGLGTFQDIYRTYDDPNRTDRSYVNHAHNDYLEVALELGVPGLLLVLAFIGWWGVQTHRVWTGEFAGAALARAGTLVIGVVLLHSLVDYPIRTAAIAALFGAACALIVPSVGRRGADADERQGKGEGLRHLAAG